MSAVRVADSGLYFLLVGRPSGAPFFDQGSQGFFVDDGVHHFFDDPVGMSQRGISHLEEELVLPRHPPKVRDELLLDLLLRAPFDAMDGLDEQLDERVHNLVAAQN